MSTSRQGRTAAIVAVVITGLATVYTLALLLGAEDPSWAYLPRGLVHLGELAALVALARCGAAGTGRLATIGLGCAGVGQVMLAVAEVISAGGPGAGDVLFGIAPNLVGLGLILTGVAVVRTGRWSGWRRWVVLALGAYVFVVMTPVIIAVGGPPAVAALVALLGWEVLWTLIGIAVLSETAGARHDVAPAAG
jgi:hypothetical protein